MHTRSAILLVSLLALAAPRAARADDARAAAEIAALEAEIALGAKALSSGGCVVACRALGSMERAADRICALDPGPRCADARAKVRDAARRVREACVECKAPQEEAPPVRATAEPGASGDTKPPVKHVTPSAPPPADMPAPPPPPAPEAVSKRGGGCAGCVVSGDEGAAGAGALAALLALAVVARRRRSHRGRVNR